MINWFTAALIAPALWAVITVIDHNLINKIYPSVLFGTIISSVFASIPSTLILSHHQIPPFFMVTAVFAGSVSVFQFYTYFQALKLNSPSLVVAFYNLTAVLVPILSYVFLKERLNQLAIIGFLLVLIPSIILSFSAINFEHKVKALKLMLTTIVLYSASLVTMKYVYQETDFLSGFGFYSLGHVVGVVSLMIFNSKARKVVSEARLLGLTIVGVLMSIEVISVLAEFFQNLSISSGSVSLVTALEGTQPIFVLLFAILFYPFIPKLLPEAIEGNKIIKFACMITMLAGLFLIERVA